MRTDDLSPMEQSDNEIPHPRGTTVPDCGANGSAVGCRPLGDWSLPAVDWHLHRYLGRYPSLRYLCMDTVASCPFPPSIHAFRAHSPSLSTPCLHHLLAQTEDADKCPLCPTRVTTLRQENRLMRQRRISTKASITLSTMEQT